MKKRVITGCIIVIIALISAFIITITNDKSRNETNKMIDNINNNSDLPVTYMIKYENELDDKFSEYNKLHNFMSIDFSDKDIFFSFYGYPNDESDYYLGKIELRNNKYNILGINLDNSIEEAIKTFEEYGFIIEDKYDGYVSLKYDKFTIEFNKNQKVITLEVKSEYLGNRVY